MGFGFGLFLIIGFVILENGKTTFVYSKNVFEMLYAEWLEVVGRWEALNSMMNNLLILRPCGFFFMSFCTAFFSPCLLH